MSATATPPAARAREARMASEQLGYFLRIGEVMDMGAPDAL